MKPVGCHSQQRVWMDKMTPMTKLHFYNALPVPAVCQSQQHLSNRVKTHETENVDPIPLIRTRSAR